MALSIQPFSRFVCVGDSITDCNREWPIAERNGLGSGYVSLFNALLGSRHPAHGIRVFNAGQNGNTVLDLQARWDADIMALHPDWLSVCIGINDVWRQFDAPLRTEWHVPLDVFSHTLDSLLAKTRPQLRGLVLMTPFFLEPNRQEPMRAMMDAYGQAVSALAVRHDAILVDTQSTMDSLLTHQHPMALCWDRIHPSLTGHMALAQALLAALEH